jgi:hypothetical protein
MAMRRGDSASMTAVGSEWRARYEKHRAAFETIVIGLADADLVEQITPEN